VSWSRKLKVHATRKIRPRTSDYYPASVLRDAKVRYVKQSCLNTITGGGKITLYPRDCFAASQAQDSSHILGQEEPWLLLAYDSQELAVETVSFVMLKTQHVGLRESLAGESTDHDIALWNQRRRNVCNIRQNDMRANVPAVSGNGVRVDVVGPDDRVASLDQPQVEATRPGEERNNTQSRW
jgi:hypothetical protein